MSLESFSTATTRTRTKKRKSMEESKIGQIIDIAKLDVPFEGNKYLLLRRLEPKGFAWFLDNDDSEVPTGIVRDSIALAFQEGFSKFKMNSFRPVLSGFRYMLPERDEHGERATFSEMCRSYASSNGIYFDEALGHNCYVQNASLEALNLFRNFKKAGRLETPLKK